MQNQNCRFESYIQGFKKMNTEELIFLKAFCVSGGTGGLKTSHAPYGFWLLAYN